MNISEARLKKFEMCNIIYNEYNITGDDMNFFRNLFMKMGAGFRRFMMGRYGSDKLNLVLLGISVLFSLIASFIPQNIVKLILVAISYSLMIWAIYRMLSRKTYKRYLENRKFLQFIDRIRDRQHRYYDCPRCRQQVRVPKGKGKIAITCPKCKEKFVKKT